MIGVITEATGDGSGIAVAIDLYLDGSTPPTVAPFTPKAAGYYTSSGFHIDVGMTPAQAQAAFAAVVGKFAQQHQALTTTIPNIIGRTVTVAG